MDVPSSPFCREPACLELHQALALGPEPLGQFVVERELRRLLRLELVEVEAGLALDLRACSDWLAVAVVRIIVTVELIKPSDIACEEPAYE